MLFRSSVVRSEAILSVIVGIAVGIVTLTATMNGTRKCGRSREWAAIRIVAMTSVVRVVVVSVVWRIVSQVVSRVRIVAVVDRLRWHRSIRTFRRGSRRLAVCRCEHQRKTMLDERKTAIVTAKAVAVVAVVGLVAEVT